MQLEKNEILTGLLVIGTIGVIAFLLVLLGAPGLFRPLVTYGVYFDNAAGIKPGAVVMLAGRKIGQVQKLYSPLTPAEEKQAQQAAAAIHPSESNASPSASPRGRGEDVGGHQTRCQRSNEHHERPSEHRSKSQQTHRRKLRTEPRAHPIQNIRRTPLRAYRA